MLLSGSALGTGSLPLGLVSASSDEASLPLLWSCSVCSKCGARANGFCTIDAGRWKCIICGQLTALESDKTREFSFSAFEVSLSDAASSKSRANHHSILVIDENLPSKELFKLRDALEAVLHSLPDDFYLGLIFFGKSIHIHELGTLGGRLSCEAFSGTAIPTNDDVRDLAQHESAVSNNESFVAPLHVCRSTVLKTLTFKADRALNSSSTASSTKSVQRCFGTAIEYAMNLIKVCDATTSSILVVTNGAPSIGPGSWRIMPEDASSDTRDMVERHRMQSRQYYSELSLLASSMNVGINVFCTGQCEEFGIPAVVRLTRNVFFRSADCTHSLTAALAGETTKIRSIEVMISNDKRLIPVHAAGAEEGANVTNFTTRGSATVFLEDKSKPSMQGETFVQTICRTTGSGREVVATYRFSFARPFSVLDGDVLAVVVAKRAAIILESSKGDVTLAKRHIENEVHNVGRLVRDGTIDPSQFDKFTRNLFHFYRGPLLDGPGSQYTSEYLEVLRTRFLYMTDNAQALLMMCPALVTIRWGRLGQGATSPPPKPTALSTLSTQSDCCLVLDQLNEVLVWFGNDVPKDARERAEALKFAQQLMISLNRFPAARLMSFEESSPKARWLRCRLAPEHRDAAVIAAHNRTNMEDTRKLVSKLWTTPRNDLTFSEFLHLCMGDSRPSKPMADV